MEPDELVLEVLRHKEDLQQLLRSQAIESNCIKLLMEIWTIVGKSTLRANIIDIFSMLPNTTAMKVHLETYIQELAVQGLTQDNKEVCFQNVLAVLEQLSKLFPRSITALPIAELFLALNKIVPGRNDDLKSRLDDLVLKRAEFIQQDTGQNRKAGRVDASTGPPPEDFRDLPIQPTRDDLKPTSKPFLRPI